METTGLPESSPVIDFYNGKSIFITGGTGFLGTVLIEKLLYSCDGIKKIYVLTKQKNGDNIDQRMKKYLKSRAFYRLREKRPDFESKIIPICGDIAQKNLGISEEDITTLANEVSVVFHVAARISFNMDLTVAFNLNTRGTLELVEICKKMRGLTAFVYVSSAYSNCNRPVVEEKVYDMVVSAEAVGEIIQHSKRNDYSKYLLDGRPNTYTYTKALSEIIMQRNSSLLPCAIVRPSIIISSVSEPEPGWLVGWSGINGIVNAAMTGTLNCAYADPNVIIDIIPVDYTANLIIASAWDVSVTRAKGDKNIKVFNCCSGMQNPITVNYLMSATVGLNRRNNKDMKAGIWFVNQKRPLFYYIQLYLLNIIPAIFQDFTSFLFGKSRRNYKAVQKLAQLMYFLHYFCINEFLFIDRNVQRLYNSMSKTDRALFNFDVKNVRWMETLNNFTIGLHRISGRIRKE